MMETERTVFLLENEAGGWEEVSIPIGVGMLASQYFRHEPPTDGEVEHAIMVVEDALALVQDRLSVGMLLQSAEPRFVTSPRCPVWRRRTASCCLEMRWSASSISWPTW